VSDGFRTPMHARDHRPGGADPSWNDGVAKTSILSFVARVTGAAGPDFVTGENMAASADIPNPVPMRFRIVTGKPNKVDDDGNVTYYPKVLEFQGDITGAGTGDTVFVLPVTHRKQFDLPVPGHDDAGGYVACRLLSTGEFVYGAA